MIQLMLHAIVFVCSVFWCSSVLAGDIILPQGNRSLHGADAADHERREEIRKNRLKQQGQAENYRVEGEMQGGTKGPKTDPAVGHNRQDTGIEDPSVNPGQSAGLKTIRGRIAKSEANTLHIEQENGTEIVLTIDPQTRVNTELHPGDRITATVTSQGRAAVVQKEGKPKP
ncbi:MAG: hypothetical protein IPM58_12845 [Nitrospira sp.]|nr:hypothetical protein [Nitrospira sp.]